MSILAGFPLLGRNCHEIFQGNFTAITDVFLAMVMPFLESELRKSGSGSCISLIALDNAIFRAHEAYTDYQRILLRL